MKRTDEPTNCNCNFCRTYNRYRWAVVMECKCGCHDSGVPLTGHESLCCEFPNGKKSDNPYPDLKPAKVYKEILNLIDKQPWDANSKNFLQSQKKIDKLIKKHGI